MPYNTSIDNSLPKRMKIFYVILYAFLFFVFAAILYPPIISSFFEQDLLWFIPTMSGLIAKDMSFAKFSAFLLNPHSLWYDIPSLKLYTFLILSLLGPQAKYFIFASLIFHLASSILLFFVCKRLGLGFRTGFFSALMYLTIFAHFHSYFWPMAFQHLIVVFFVLLVLNLYLKTDRLISEGGAFRIYWGLTLMINLLASFCRASILILPIVILTHILFCSKDDSDRVKKYGIWLPLFITYLGYPLFVLATLGDNRLSMVFARINILLKFPLLFFLGIVFLLLFRVVLQLYQRYQIDKMLRWVLPAVASSCIFLLLFTLKDINFLKDIKNTLFVYNFSVPFMGLLASFIHPLGNVLLIDSTRPYHFVPLQLDIFIFLLGVFLLYVFIKDFVFKNKHLIILAVWYLLSLVYLNLRSPLVSRYLVYISAVFCVVFSASVVYLFAYITQMSKFKAVFKDIILALLFVALCIPNILAIRLEVFRGKLANNFLLYDYIRMANIIKDNLDKKKQDITPAKICINNIVPMPFEIWAEVTSVDVSKYENLRYVLAQVFANNSMLDVRINQDSCGDGEYIHYALNGVEINDAAGRNIDLFSQKFQRAMREIERNDLASAEGLLQEAVQTKPFLLNYILSGHRFEDLKWITNGLQIRSWLDKIILRSYNREGKPSQKTTYIRSIMNEELDAYIQCLFFLSYLKYLSGDMEESRYYFSKIRYLEKDYQTLYSWLSQIPQIRSDDRILSFLNSFNDFSFFDEGEYHNTYEFERFIFKLIFNKEITKEKGRLQLI